MCSLPGQLQQYFDDASANEKVKYEKLSRLGQDRVWDTWLVRRVSDSKHLLLKEYNAWHFSNDGRLQRYRTEYLQIAVVSDHFALTQFVEEDFSLQDGKDGRRRWNVVCELPYNNNCRRTQGNADAPGGGGGGAADIGPAEIEQEEEALDWKSNTLHSQISQRRAKQLEGAVVGDAFFEESVVCGIAVQLVLALESIHRRRMSHGQVNSSNIWITSSSSLGLVTLGEFGCDDENGDCINISDYVDRAAYYAPEQWEGHRADSKCDVWALGALLFEVMALQRAFNGAIKGSAARLRDAICSGKPSASLIKHYSDDLTSFTLSLMQKDPKRRPSLLEEVSLSPFFSSILRTFEDAVNSSPREYDRAKRPQILKNIQEFRDAVAQQQQANTKVPSAISLETFEGTIRKLNSDGIWKKRYMKLLPDGRLVIGLNRDGVQHMSCGGDSSSGTSDKTTRSMQLAKLVASVVPVSARVSPHSDGVFALNGVANELTMWFDAPSSSEASEWIRCLQNALLQSTAS